MSDAAFGLTMLVVGMGGTLATLLLVALLIQALTVLFPVRPGRKESGK